MLVNVNVANANFADSVFVCKVIHTANIRVSQC